MIFLILLHGGYEAKAERRKCMIGFDCAETVRATGLDIQFNHSIDKHWSVSFGMSIYPMKFIRIYDNEDNAHYNEFKDEDSIIETGTDERYISFHYWKDDAFDGAELGFGIIYPTQAAPDITAEAGYYAKITTHLRLGFRFKINIRETCKDKGFSGNEVKVSINWLF